MSTVGLNWTGNLDSSSYNVYRSPVQGGGYVKIGTATGATFTDSNVSNGTTYYYVVRGLDSLGNEGPNSNEANATPAFPIGYAVLQWPKTITHVITANYTTVSITQSLTFTPAAPFTVGTYTVTIDHVVSLTVQNDGIKIRTPYVLNFTVN